MSSTMVIIIGETVLIFDTPIPDILSFHTTAKFGNHQLEPAQAHL